MPKSKSQTIPPLISWSLKTWAKQAPHIWPGNGEDGRGILRAHKAELYQCGALTRVGREIIFLGPGYQTWLVSNKSRVFDYEIPPNRPENAGKRFGRAT
jgi:hypothetical protein